ncbi:MAG TPA: hypothetical protein VMU92_11460 [Acidobacteriaceae bacterium]|nr:hypothetical protein [Acidobacteriaceae bacterium]
MVENRSSSGDKQYVDKGKTVNVENAINHTDAFQGVGGKNYQAFMNGKATGDGATNATNAVTDVHKNGTTTDAGCPVQAPLGREASHSSSPKNLSTPSTPKLPATHSFQTQKIFAPDVFELFQLVIIETVENFEGPSCNTQARPFSIAFFLTEAAKCTHPSPNPRPATPQDGTRNFFQAKNLRDHSTE